jgi:cyanophycinase-like exopeptidase
MSEWPPDRTTEEEVDVVELAQRGRMTGRLFGLLGSGEFEPWTEPVDRWLLERATGDGSVLILPVASAPEGSEVFERWGTMGLEHYDDLGIPADVVPLETRGDAERPDLIRMLEGASMAFFSGGNPAYLTSVLRGSSFWEALLSEMDRGLAYAGCSAGVACLGELAVDNTIHDFTSSELWRPALRLFPNVYFGPHWDALDRYMPGLQALFVSAVPAGSPLLGIDERTAVVGDGTTWSVLGSGAATLIEEGIARSFESGTSFDIAFLPGATVEALPTAAADPDPRPAG